MSVNKNSHLIHEDFW